MFDFSETLDTIKDFASEKRNVAIAVCILVILFFLGIFAFVLQKPNSENKLKVPEAQEQPLSPDQKILLPEGPSIPDGYALTRTPKEKWSLEEASEYFTVPDSDSVDKLSSDNDKLIDEILGAAP